MWFRLFYVAADHDTLPATQLSPSNPVRPQVAVHGLMYNLSGRLTRTCCGFTVAAMADLEPISVVVTSVGTEQQAVEISEELVARGLATCINVLPCQRSIYRWKGKVCTDSEYLLMIKTRSALFDAVVEAIRDIHSYELPEVLEFPVARAEKHFHAWVTAMATGMPDPEGEPEGESEASYD